MRIRQLRIQTFRNHTDSLLDFGDTGFIVVRGSNFAGKSSIVQAISLLLTPSTDGLDAQGRGYATKIKRGEAKSTIIGEIKGKSHTVRRTVVLNTNTTGRAEHSECVDDPDWSPLPFTKLLDSNRSALSVCLNTAAFLAMDEKAQKSLLARLALPSSYDFPEDVMDQVDNILGNDVVEFAGEPFAVIDKAYKKLFDERTVVNRLIKEAATLSQNQSPLTQSPDTAVVRKELDDTKKEREKILAARDAAVRKANEFEVKRAKLNAEISSLLANVEEGRTRIKAIEPSILTLEQMRLVKAEAAKKDGMGLLQELIRDSERIIVERRKTMDRYKALSGDQALCTACGQPVTAEYIASAIRNAEAAYTAAEDDILKKKEAMKEFSEVGKAIETISAHESATGERARIEASLQKTVEDGKAKRTALSELGEAKEATAEFTQPLADVDEKITRLTEALASATAQEQIGSDREENAVRLKKLEAKSANIDNLVNYFGKDGIKAKLLLAEHIGTFENRINEVMHAFGYRCSLSIEPYQFMVRDARGVTTPVQELSGSEQLMFSVALQCAVARAAGVGMVVADRLDTFVQTQRQKVNKALYTAILDGTLEQAILVMSDENTNVPSLPNAMFFVVRDGEVERLTGKG